jgi:hypothetical protein
MQALYPELERRIARGKREHGEKFDSSALEECHALVARFYGTDTRVRVQYGEGEGAYTRTGRISTTTGWKPAFLLVHRRGSYGSSDVLGPKDRVIEYWDGKRYVPISGY